MRPKTVLILGGYGHTGQMLARLLLRHSDARLVLAGRRPEQALRMALALNRECGDERAAGIGLDAADEEGLRRAFPGMDLVAVTSSTARCAPQVARAALEAGCDYFDVQYSARKVAALAGMQEDILRAGRCFITDGGFHPGLPAVMVRWAADRFDALERAVVGSVIQENWAALDLPLDTVAELLEEMGDFRPLVCEDGAWKNAGWLDRRAYRSMDFGPPFGRRSCMAMFLEELRPLPDQISSLRETGFFVGGFNFFVDWVVLPLALAGLSVWPGALRPLSRMMKWGLERFSRPPYGTLLRLEAEGHSGGREKRLALTLDHPDGYLMTAAPAAACLLQVLDGSARRPGLHTQAQLVEPERMLRDIERMGVDLRLEENPG